MPAFVALLILCVIAGKEYPWAGKCFSGLRGTLPSRFLWCTGG
jgi:hypothetical protein